MYAKLLVPDHRLSLVVPRSSPEVYGIAVSLIGVERIGLETDLVRRPRVRGTAPLATVGKERRLFYFENAFTGGVYPSAVVPRFSLETSGRWTRSFFRCLPG